MKIGVFDSGVGGITVLLELKKQLPNADFVYLGDTANVPYGTKSPKVVEKLSLDAVDELRHHDIDALVVACNTASSLALPAIKKAMGDVPVMGVVEPGARAAMAAIGARAASASPDVAPVILVLATRATVNSGAYKKALAASPMPKRLPERSDLPPDPCPFVVEQACPLLVPMIEEGFLEHPLLHGVVQEYVSDHFRHHVPGVALLGCTHYPWIQAAIELSLPGWKVVNSAEAVASSFKERFKEQLAKLPAPRQGGSGKVEWIFTDPLAVPAFAKRWVHV